MSRKLINERASLMANELLAIVQSCLPLEDHQDAYDELFADFCDVCRRGLNAHAAHAGMMHRRLNPSIN